MKKFLSPFFLIVLFVLSLTTVAAQDDVELSEEVVVADGYSIFVPEDWDVEEDDEHDGIILSDGDLTLYVLGPEQLEEFVEIDEKTEARSILRTAYDELYGELPPRSDVEEITIDGRAAASYSYELNDDDIQGTFFVIQMSDDTFGVVDAYVEDGDFEDSAELVENIVATFNASDTTTVAAAAEPCFISTDDEDTVQLRVGPGTNRGVVAFLPAGEEFEVTGQFVTEDGSVWYQLDKEEAAPNSAAAEIWVAAEDVDESGDCNQVVDTSAPPIVPITNTQPTTSNEPADTSTTDSAATESIIPRTGYWTVTLAPTSTASCFGTQTITYDSNESFPDGLVFEVYMSSANGSTFVLNGDTYTLQSNGFYAGPSLFFLIDLDNSQTYLHVVSATLMVGSSVANVTINGRGCSQTTEMTLTHN